ncbi:Alpha/Beta hydrolase protein [Infundibulicybe gibba]|nr:Alpha/Beta hydrolase protein [Infundibulicybe gibba]
MSDAHPLTTATIKKIPPLPATVERRFLSTQDGDLELNVSLPFEASTKPPILFVHGGFGSAHCWVNYLPYFSRALHPSYAISLRGHGCSFNPGYWRLYFTPRSTFVDEIRQVVSYIRSEHGVDPIVVGHSSGGGALQALCSSGTKVAGMALLGSIPGSGSFQVNRNWMAFDPYMMLRMLKHLLHPRSALSSTSLVHAAFFAPDCPREKVRECELAMAESESMVWPLGMTWRFVQPENVVANITGVGLSAGRKMLVIAGELDRLVTVGIAQALARWYRNTSRQNEEVIQEEVVYRVGHHMMLDSNWEEGARKLLAWLGGTDSA